VIGSTGYSADPPAPISLRYLFDKGFRISASALNGPFPVSTPLANISGRDDAPREQRVLLETRHMGHSVGLIAVELARC